MPDAKDNAGSQQGFYVVQEECISCGVPQQVAPDLVAIAEVNGRDGICVWVKQPGSPEEFDQAIEAVNQCCVGAHRYGGRDPRILERLEPYCCDHPLQPPKATLLERLHARLVKWAAGNL